MLDQKTKGMLIPTLLLAFFVPSVFSQTQVVKTLGGADEDGAHSLIQTTDGGYAIAGFTLSFGAGSEDVLLAKFDDSWNHEWTTALGGADIDGAYSLIQTADGGYALAGDTRSFGFPTDVLFSKFTAFGVHEWTRNFGGLNSDIANCLIQTFDGGYAIAGYTNSFGADSYDALLSKFDGFGIHQWTRTLGGTDIDRANSLIQTPDSGYIIAGDTRSFGAGISDVLLAKFDPLGNYQWARTLGGLDNDIASSLIETGDGGYAITGYTQSYGAGSYDALLAKFDAAWNHQWTRTLGGANSDYANSLIQTGDGAYVIAGNANSFGAGLFDVLLAKFDGAGNHQWTWALGGGDQDRGRSLIQTMETVDAGYAIAGYTLSYGVGSDDVLLAKFDTLGRSCLGDFVAPVINIVTPSLETPDPDVDTIFPYIDEPPVFVLPGAPEVRTVCPLLVFIRGDADRNGMLSLSDGLYCFRCQFVPGWGDSCNCDDATDADDNGAISIGDCLRILRKQFVPGWQDSIPPPCCSAPTDCGADPTPDGLGCEEHPCIRGVAAEAKRIKAAR